MWRLMSVRRAELKHSVVDKAVDQWWPRLRTRVHDKGQHFEQF